MRANISASILSKIITNKEDMLSSHPYNGKKKLYALFVDLSENEHLKKLQNFQKLGTCCLLLYYSDRSIVNTIMETFIKINID